MTEPHTVFGLFTTVRNAVRVKGMGFEFVYGPTKTPTVIGATRLVWQRERGVGETLKPATANQRNPRMTGRRGLPILVRIHAQSTRQGAQIHEHEEIARAVSEQVLVELERAAIAFKTTREVTFSGLVENTDTPTDWSGVTHEIRFTVDDGVFDVAWTGEAATETDPDGLTISTTTNTTGPAPRTDLPSATTRTEA